MQFLVSTHNYNYYSHKELVIFHVRADVIQLLFWPIDYVFHVMHPAYPKHTNNHFTLCCCRHKTKAKSFKPDVTKDHEEGQKTSPLIPCVQPEQTDWKAGDEEHFEMQANNGSQGRAQMLVSCIGLCV